MEQECTVKVYRRSSQHAALDIKVCISADTPRRLNSSIRIIEVGSLKEVTGWRRTRFRICAQVAQHVRTLVGAVLHEKVIQLTFGIVQTGGTRIALVEQAIATVGNGAESPTAPRATPGHEMPDWVSQDHVETVHDV
jgi:hypothetical protein